MSGQNRYNTKQTLRRQKMRTGDAHISGESQTVLSENELMEGESGFSSGENGAHEGESDSQTVEIATVENENPEKNHLRSPRKIGYFERKWKAIKRFWRPDPTPAELEILEQERKQRRIRAMMIRQMAIANRLIPNAYANLGFEYRRKDKSKHERDKITRVRFSKWLYSDDGNTIYGKIASNGIPYNVNPIRLVDKDVLTALATAVGHPVGGQIGDNGEGIHIFISLAGRNDFPDSILFRSMLPKIPKDALPLTFLCGATKNGGREYRSLESLPHFMGAGETGGGKTNFMHSMICTMISRNKPDDVRLMMIDLKFGGVALNRYEGIPHLIHVPEREYKEKGRDLILPAVECGIANDVPGAVSILHWALGESLERGQLFLTDKIHHPDNIGVWNKYHRTKKLPRIVVFIDELAMMMDKSDVEGKIDKFWMMEARYYIKTILRLSRSSGVHICGFTQSLDKSVMGVTFKTNISGRIAFSVADATASTLIVGDGAAVNLRPAGRAIYKHGTDKFMCQTPLITEADISEIIRNAKEGRITAAFSGRAITPEDLIRFAVNEGNNSLSNTTLWNKFRNQIAYEDLIRRLLPSMDDQIFEIDGDKYKVIRGMGKLPRRVEKVEEPL